MELGKFRETSDMTGKHQMTSVKSSVPFVSGRQHDDRQRKAADIFRNASDVS